MISFFSSWGEQIVLAVVIATIIEMILPEGNNKKYIKMVIGVFVVFSIISPFIKNKDIFDLDKFDISKYTETASQEIDQTSMNKRLKRIWKEELEEKVIAKFEELDYKVKSCNIDVELDGTKKDAGIHSVEVKLKESIENLKKINEIKEQIAQEFEIDENIINIY